MKSVEEIFESVGRSRGVCKGCGLFSKCHTPFMRGRGNSVDPVFAVVGEAPGQQEDNKGQPFVGPSGEVLRSVVRDFLGLLVNEHTYITNSVRCRPPDNKMAKSYLNACREFLIDELFAVNPKVIVPLGNTPLESLTGKAGKITDDRGIVQRVTLRSSWGEERDFTIVPSFHPAYILRNPSALDYLALDMKKAKEVADFGGIMPALPAADYRVVWTKKDATELKAEVRKAKRVAWDTETTGINAFAENAAVVCVSISTKPGTGWLIPIDHDEAHKCELTREKRIELAKWILCDSKKPLCGQNLKFDGVYVTANLGFRPQPPAFDCYIAHHLIAEEESEVGGNGLKAMAWKYTQMGGYEKPLEDRYPDMYNRMRSLPLETEEVHDSLTWYACADVDVALQIMDAIMPRLQEENLLDVLQMEHDKSEFLMDLELQGQAIDWDYQQELEKRFPETIENIRSRLREYPEVIEAETKFAKRKGKDDIFGATEPFNPKSTEQMKILCLDVLQLPRIQGLETGTGQQSVGKEALATWKEHVHQGGPAFEILELISHYISMKQLHSLYVKSMPEHRCRDGKVHARFNGAKVVTWRLSAEAPNVMQLPRADDGAAEGEVGKGDIKRMYISAFNDGFVLEADYSQIELRIAALISQDAEMIDEFWKDKCDLHRKTAAGMYEIDEEEVQDWQRSNAKIVNFGIIYQMQARALAAKLGISEEEAQYRIDKLFAQYCGFAAWVEETKAFVKQKGYVESLFGHRRHLPNVHAADMYIREEAYRKAVNSPIQNTASNLTIYAGGYLSRILKEDGLESRLFGQVHDSLQVTGPRREMDKAIEMTLLVMENMPFPFLTGDDPRFPATVPIKADAKVGPNLRDLKKI